jgi:hypothetical protein
MKFGRLFLMAVCVLFLGAVALNASSAPKMMNYQGLLLDSNGDPVTSCVSMTFTVYDAASGGNVVWQETHSSVCPDEGLFEVMLGNGDTPVELGEDVFSAPDRWLGVAVNGEAELAPRTRLVTGAYSHRVSTVDGAAAGAIAGPMEIIPDIARRSDGSLIIRGAGSCDAVTINPTLDVALEATNDACEQVLFLGAANSGGVLELHATDAVKALTRMVEIDPAQGLALRATEQGGDETVAITSQNTGASIYVSSTDAAKALARTVGISPADGNVLISTEANGDQTVAITSNPQGGSVLVTSTDVAKALTRKVEIAPAQNVAMRVTEQNDDDVFLLSSNENGAALEVNSSDALKGVTRTVGIKPGLGTVLSSKEQNGDETILITSDAMGGNVLVRGTDVARGITSTVEIKPADSLALLAHNSTGDSLISLSTSGSTGRITLTSNTAKGLRRIEIKEDGIYFFDESRSDTNMIVYADGSIAGKGQISMGKENGDLANWSNVLGFNNEASGDSSSVCGGYNNSALGYASVVCGGSNNTATGDWTIVGGGGYNHAVQEGDAVFSGGYNQADGYFSFIGGGIGNRARGFYAVVGGGGGGAGQVDSNLAKGDWSTVSGGRACIAEGNNSVVGGGHSNNAIGVNATVAGGTENSAEANGFVGGGQNNDVTGSVGVVCGGFNNEAGGNAVVSGGSYNACTGYASAIVGGEKDTVVGSTSMAFGYQVLVNNNSRVMFFNDIISGRFGVNRDDHDSLLHPIHVGTNTSNGNGAYLSAGGTWTNGSSRNYKENFRPLEGEELLAKLAVVPVTSWNYRNSEERHIGPVAEDFVAAFDVGCTLDDGSRDDKYLSTMDVAGVALVAIQALNEKTKEIDDLKTQLEELKALVNRLLSERQ